ncbi:MAG: TIGR02281 family clan AA aspartic protease [Gammaproteobacteria bacterium]|nr:TIGR02281 family clan AA aspartic protease [Gammaproteobacteria bacterium]
MFGIRPKVLALLAVGALFCSPPLPAVEKVSIKGLFKDKAILVIDGKQRLLRTGETSPEGVTLVSANSKEAVIEIDGVQTARGLGAHIGSEFSGPETTAVRIWPTARNMYPVVGSINGYPVNFLVDTGATSIAMNSLEAKRLGIDFAVEGQPTISQTASGLAKAWIINLKRVKVGDIELTNVRAAVLEGNYPTQVLLGMSFLGRLDMRREGGVLELRKKY